MKKLFTDPDTPATILNCAILKLYGVGVYVWEPETLWLQLGDDFRIDVDEFCKHKICAIITLLTTSQFYDYWETFENICIAFNDQDVKFEDMTPLSAEELAWGLMEAKLNEDKFYTISGDTMAYITTILQKEGLAKPPEFISDMVKYPEAEEYDKKKEKIFQSRIKVYCIDRLNKIISLAKKYLKKDIKKDIIECFPILEQYL